MSLTVNNGSGTAASQMAIVADKVTFQGGAHLLANLAKGRPKNKITG